MLSFGDCRDAADPSVIAVVAVIDGYPAGSVAVKTWADGDISIARLFVDPAYRRHGIARQMMRRIFVLYPDAEAWLYAGPYIWEGEPGPGRGILESFYRALGFVMTVDGDGNPAMVRKGY